MICWLFFESLFVYFVPEGTQEVQIAYLVNFRTGITAPDLYADFLITDYIAVGGMGAAFVNAGMMALISIYFVYSLGMEMDGHTITSCCLMFGFSLFGKKSDEYLGDFSGCISLCKIS